jgi:preprotein translocase SecE subunit
MERLINYIKDTKGEMQHVSWPTRKQAISVTAIVVVISGLVALYLGFFDYILSLILQKFIL